MSTLQKLLKKYTIKVSVSNDKTFALIDTGASISCISQPCLAKTSFWNAALEKSDFLFIKSVSGKRLKVLGKLVLPIAFKGHVYNLRYMSLKTCTIHWYLVSTWAH